MRTSILLVSAAALVTVLTACSSKWEQREALAPITVDFSEGETVVEATIRLERVDAKDDALKCGLLEGSLALGWVGADGVPVDLTFADGEGDPIGGGTERPRDAQDGEALGHAGTAFVQEGPGACVVTVTAFVSSEVDEVGELTVEVIASDTSLGTEDEPKGNVTLSADLRIEVR